MSELMTGYHQITFDEYLSAKQEITTRLMDMSEDFVVIGYLLRQIDANKAYEQDGYSSLKDFAKAEYNLSESSVSRFMAINKAFSEDGFSRNLITEYRGYGYSKLQEMLTLDVQDRELVTEATTVAEIREIKAFEREEKQLAKEEEKIERVEAEVVSEGPLKKMEEFVEKSQCEVVSEPRREYSNLEQIIIEFFRDKRDLLTEIYQMSSVEDIVECINPTGNKTFKYKIFMLFMYGFGEGVVLKQMLKDNVKYSWQQFVDATVSVFSETYTDHDSVWENFYGVTSMKTENMHVSEEKSVEKKVEQDRDFSTKTEDLEEKKEVVQASQEQLPAEDELEGQMHIEDYPEAIPEGFATSQDREKSIKTADLEDGVIEVGKLTWKKSDGTWGLKKIDIVGLPNELYAVAYKLMKYENTGLSPEQIEDMLNEK